MRNLVSPRGFYLVAFHKELSFCRYRNMDVNNEVKNVKNVNKVKKKKVNRHLVRGLPRLSPEPAPRPATGDC
jgi:hypothetical protein